jgi:hypothetical protein
MSPRYRAGGRNPAGRRHPRGDRIEALIRSARRAGDTELAELLEQRLAPGTSARARRASSPTAERIIRQICRRHGLPYRGRR